MLLLRSFTSASSGTNYESDFENEDDDVIGIRAEQSMAKLERDKQSMLLKQIFRVDQSFEA